MLIFNIYNFLAVHRCDFEMPKVIRKRDPVTFELLMKRMSTIVDEAGVIMYRAAYSPIVTEGMDFSGVILDKEGNLIIAGKRDIPMLSATMDFTCKRVLSWFKDDLAEGDTFLCNEPAYGTHLNDVRAIRPIFYRHELVAFAGYAVHWADVGGWSPGGFGATSREIYAEGLQIPPVKVVKTGKIDRDIVNIIKANTRTPLMCEGDLRAMIQAVRAMDESALKLIETFGPQTFDWVVDQIFVTSEESMKRQIELLPEGEYRWEDRNDLDLLFVLALKIKRGQLTYDFTGTDHWVPLAINHPLASTHSLIRSLHIFIYNAPLNEGSFRRVRVIAPQGSLANPPPYAPTCGAFAASRDHMQNCIFGAYSKIDAKRTVASEYSLFNNVIGGFLPDKDEHFVAYLFPGGGHGAGQGFDGQSALVGKTWPGTTNQPIEVWERVFPIIFQKMGLVEDSGGSGKWRGGLGVILTYGPLNREVTVSAITSKTKYAPFGLFGGKSGKPTRYVKNIGREDEEELSGMTTGLIAKPGETLTLMTAGGGGFGRAFERDPQLVLEDVREGYVSVTTARQDYGVLIDPEKMEIKWDETLRKRTQGS
jgi:N-methylhydantoinase B